jgi:8-oxo-dGTP diphosphatase
MPNSRDRSKKASTSDPTDCHESTRGDAVNPLRDKVFGVLVSAATFHRGRILLLQRSDAQKFMPGAWSLPAGKLQPHEASLEEAVKRELYEEAGIKGEVEANLGMSWFESIYYEQPVHHVQFNFVLRALSADVALLDGSNSDYRWISIDDLRSPPVPIDAFTRSVIEPAITYVRAHL